MRPWLCEYGVPGMPEAGGLLGQEVLVGAHFLPLFNLAPSKKGGQTLSLVVTGENDGSIPDTYSKTRVNVAL